VRADKEDDHGRFNGGGLFATTGFSKATAFLNQESEESRSMNFTLAPGFEVAMGDEKKRISNCSAAID